VSGTTSPLSQISPMGSGILNPNGGGSGGASVAATRAHSGVAPGPPPPSEASQRVPYFDAWCLPERLFPLMKRWAQQLDCSRTQAWRMSTSRRNVFVVTEVKL
jgi:hypothetical protein